MPTYQNPIDDDERLSLAETDKPLAETLNPAFRYALFSQIAKGGKSTIQSCMDLYLGRKVCHKSLRREFASDDIEQRRLLREARIIARLQHPNIVPTYDLGRTRDGGYFFTMKLLEGYTLRELLDYRERYDLTQMINVIEQIANALAFAHQLRHEEPHQGLDLALANQSPFQLVPLSVSHGQQNHKHTRAHVL